MFPPRVSSITEWNRNTVKTSSIGTFISNPGLCWSLDPWLISPKHKVTFYICPTTPIILLNIVLQCLTFPWALKNSTYQVGCGYLSACLFFWRFPLASEQRLIFFHWCAWRKYGFFFFFKGETLKMINCRLSFLFFCHLTFQQRWKLSFFIQWAWDNHPQSLERQVPTIAIKQCES